MADDATLVAARFALQVGVILLAAKVGAELFERWLRQPGVLGELTAGIVIGPFALGGIPWPALGPLIEPSSSTLAVPEPLWAFAELAAVILLFMAGLETDFAQFVRFGPRAIVIALGGVLVPFGLGVGAALMFGFAPDPLSPAALFAGAALTATSVAVTARILGDLGKLDTPEGLTILGAAVVDDVLGILVLALVVAVESGSGLNVADLGLLLARALGTWLVLTAVLVLAAERIAGLVLRFRSAGAPLALTIGLALIAGFVAQNAGLAMIIGAFSAGVALSRSRLRDALNDEIRSVYHAIVPAFFVVVGMQVDLRSLVPVLGFAIVLTLLGVAGKLIGCAVPAFVLGYGRAPSLRIGAGMVPRGEVALIIAGIGLASGAIDGPLFSAVVFMAVATTLVAPLLLQPGFGGRAAAPAGLGQAGRRFTIALPMGLLDPFERLLLRIFAERGYELAASWTGDGDVTGRELRRGATLVSIRTLPAGVEERQIELESEEAGDLAEILLAAADAAAEESARAVRSAAAAALG